MQRLKQPGRDMRESMAGPLLRKDVLSMEDLKPGMELQGTVRNVVDFGTFVDIGVKQDGLVHISKLSKQFVKHPTDVVSVGDIVQVWVLEVDLKKQRIQTFDATFGCVTINLAGYLECRSIHEKSKTSSNLCGFSTQSWSLNHLISDATK
ncbi:S1 RNA-binding domain-containing protein [Erysipelothrix sp. D19-032]